jgi:hypothetical protein
MEESDREAIRLSDGEKGAVCFFRYKEGISGRNALISLYVFGDTVYYGCTGVTEALGYKKRNQVSNVKRGINKSYNFEDHVVKMKVNNQPRNSLDSEGLSMFLAFCYRTHPISVQRFSNTLREKGLFEGPLFDNAIPTKESDTISKIRSATFKFDSETSFLIRTNGRKSRRLDLYYPKQKLCVECDENGHTYYDQEDEEDRKNLIHGMGITTYRYNPDEYGFDIYTTIGEILHILYTYGIPK